ncbi:hypothetical protein [Thiocapsa marina]|uniref:hypothetical protein n=1 Tax=Thiocapsa marina TaxID=244573 RepID=UPI001111FA77|nr:hypothetical protein [Thiocapsa marina]
MRLKVQRTSIGAVFVLVVGCTMIPGRTSSTSAQESIDLGVLFDSVAAIRHTSPDVLRKAAAEANPDHPSELLHWSVVLIVLGRPSDKKRAIELLDTYLTHTDQAPGSVLLANLLLQQLQDELRLQRRVAKAIGQRNELSKQFEGRKGELQERIQELEGREQQLEGREEELTGLRRQLAELETQLEGLKRIELEMQDRALAPDLELPRLESPR